ncbi:hypothetical protein FLA_0192 [Filimonas lacunae]|nr:hypothetical protein FLA_0192 [Filimonas lacunae]
MPYFCALIAGVNSPPKNEIQPYTGLFLCIESGVRRLKTQIWINRFN